MKYSEIKTREKLERDQDRLRTRMRTNGAAARASLFEVKYSFTPVNLVATGLT